MDGTMRRGITIEVSRNQSGSDWGCGGESGLIHVGDFVHALNAQ